MHYMPRFFPGQGFLKSKNLHLTVLSMFGSFRSSSVKKYRSAAVSFYKCGFPAAISMDYDAQIV